MEGGGGGADIHAILSMSDILINFRSHCLLLFLHQIYRTFSNCSKLFMSVGTDFHDFTVRYPQNKGGKSDYSWAS